MLSSHQRLLCFFFSFFGQDVYRSVLQVDECQRRDDTAAFEAVDIVAAWLALNGTLRVHVYELPLELQERWTLSSRISPETSARVPKWYANAQTLHFTEEAKRVSLFLSRKICTTNPASSRRLHVLLDERKEKKKPGKKRINKNSGRRSVTLRQYSKANVVFAYVRRRLMCHVKI